MLVNLFSGHFLLELNIHLSIDCELLYVPLREYFKHLEMQTLLQRAAMTYGWLPRSLNMKDGIFYGQSCCGGGFHCSLRSQTTNSFTLFPLKIFAYDGPILNRIPVGI